MLDTIDKNAAAATAKKEDPRPGFAEILDAHKERHRLESARGPAAGAEDDKKQETFDFSMYKLYLSLMLRMGGAAPAIGPDKPGASGVILESLEAWRCGNRRPFSQDSDLYSTPRFPVVRFKNV
jgi:hypothetical protein